MKQQLTLPTDGACVNRRGLPEIDPIVLLKDLSIHAPVLKVVMMDQDPSHLLILEHVDEALAAEMTRRVIDELWNRTAR